MTCGIYEIVHVSSGRRYIGHSRQIEYRWWQHQGDLEANSHHNHPLQNAWNKYGREAFFFRVLEECPEEILVDREDAYFSQAPKGSLYNTAKAARGPMTGRTHTEESRRKISIAGTGRKHSPESIELSRSKRVGKVRSEETKQKMRESWRGKPRSEAQIAANKSRRGKTHVTSDETKKKIGDANRGHPVTEETKRAIHETRRFLAALRRLFNDV